VIAYRRNRGIDNRAVGIAVLAQRMIDPEVRGAGPRGMEWAYAAGRVWAAAGPSDDGAPTPRLRRNSRQARFAELRAVPFGERYVPFPAVQH
jgi:hypothetical protein